MKNTSHFSDLRNIYQAKIYNVTVNIKSWDIMRQDNVIVMARPESVWEGQSTSGGI